MKRWTSMLLVALMVIPLLAACTKGSAGEGNNTRVLRIASTELYGFDDEYFRTQFTDLFAFNNPNIEIELVSTRDEKERIGNYYGYYGDEERPQYKDAFENMLEMMEGDNPPDIVMLTYDQMEEMLEKNLLTPLDSKIAEDKFDVSDYVPAVLDGIKNMSPDGKIYALAPLFNSSAIIYNKQLFIDAGVDMPTDNMTWDEMFNLASRVSKPDAPNPIYGFGFNQYKWRDTFNDMQLYASSLGLRFVDDDAENMTVDNDDWEKVWTKLYELQQQKIMQPIPNPEDPSTYENDSDDRGPFSQDNFMRGRLAMTIMNYGSLSQIIEANKYADEFKGYTPIDWDVVTMPSHPENPGVVPNVQINGLMAINAKATNPDDAWEFIKFINSPEWAKLKSQGTWQLPARKSYIKPKDGVEFNIEAFYNVKPSSFSENDYYNLLRGNNGNIWLLFDIGRREFEQVLLGKKAPRDGLKAWQTKGDKFLKEMKANPNGPINYDEYFNDEASGGGVSVQRVG